MIRRSALRLPALGLVALLQVGAFARIEHVLCAPGSPGPHGDAPSEVEAHDHASHAAPSGHQSHAPATSDEADGSSEHESCQFGCMCCPFGQPGVSVAGTAYIVPAPESFADLDAPIAALPSGVTLRLLPYPIPPPRSDLA